MTDYFIIGKQDIADIYSRLQTAHQRKEAELRERLYGEIPELAELERELTATYTGSLRSLISLPPEEAAVLKAKQKVKIQELRERKEEILRSHGLTAADLEAPYECPICKDEGYVDGERCSCYKKHLLKLLYRQSSLGSVLERENFDTFSLDYFSREPYGDRISPYENMTDLLATAKRFAKTFQPEGKSFLFYGSAGVGKTFLSNCIAKQVMDSGHSVLYVTANELFEDILSPCIMSPDPDQRERLQPVHSLIYTADLLVLDDLGTELTNEFTRSQLFEIINRRMIARRSTIISTNYSLKQFQDKYYDRILSRIVDFYELCYFYGDNIRSKRKTAALKEQTK